MYNTFLSGCKYYMHSHIMGENRAASLNNTSLTDFHSKSSKVLVRSRYNKMQSEFKLKGKNKTLKETNTSPPFLHTKIHVSVLILDTTQLMRMYVNVDTDTQRVGITEK